MSPLRILAPPARVRPLLSWNLTNHHDLRRVRDEVRAYLLATPAVASSPTSAVGAAAGEGAGEAADDLAQRIGLVATELAGNALRHGLPPVDVRLLTDDDCYIIDVSDGAPDKRPEPADTGRPVRTGGRGLQISRSLADELCWYATEDTKHVWASFPRGDVGPVC